MEGKRLSKSILDDIAVFKRRKMSEVRVNQFRFTASLLDAYEAAFGVPLYVKADINELIAFGHWIKAERSLTNSTICTYLESIISHIRSKGVPMQKKRITKEFAFKIEIPIISEDIVQAILDTTEVPDHHMHILHAIQLMILHGFRYSDLWTLKKGSCIETTPSGIKFFRYYPPKNKDSAGNKDRGVSVPCHPQTEKIIKYWSDRDTESFININKAPKAFMDRKAYAYLTMVPDSAIPGFFVFPDPIIKIPHHTFMTYAKKAVFEHCHKTWCKTEFGNSWKTNFKQPKGLMAIDTFTKKAMWESLTFHTFRHVYCSRYLAYGGNVIDLRDNVGHSSIVVTQKYAHTNEDERLSRASKLFQY